MKGLRVVKVMSSSEEDTPMEQASASTATCSVVEYSLKKTPETKAPWGFQVYATIDEREEEERTEMSGEDSAVLSMILYRSLTS